MRFFNFETGSRSVIAISFADLVRTLGRSSAVLMLPIYLLEVRHVGFIVIGSVLAVASIVASPLSLAGGGIADRIGRRPLFTLLPLLSCLLFSSISAEIFLNVHVIFLFLTLVMTWPVSSLQGTVDSAVISDVTLPQQRMHAFSLMRLAANLGFSLGPALGGIVSTVNFGYAFIIPAAANIVEEFVYLIYVKESRPLQTPQRRREGRRVKLPVDDRVFLLIALVLTFCEFCIGQWGNTLTLFLSHSYGYSTASIGLVYSLNGVIVVLLQLPVNSALSRFSDTVRLMLGMVLYSVTFLVFGLTDIFGLLLVNVVFLTIGENTFSPTSSSFVSRIAPADRRGEYFGSYNAMVLFTSPASSFLGAALLTWFSGTPEIMWGIVSALCAMAVLLLRLSGRMVAASGRDYERQTVEAG